MLLVLESRDLALPCVPTCFHSCFTHDLLPLPLSLALPANGNRPVLTMTSLSITWGNVHKQVARDRHWSFSIKSRERGRGPQGLFYHWRCLWISKFKTYEPIQFNMSWERLKLRLSPLATEIPGEWNWTQLLLTHNELFFSPLLLSENGAITLQETYA